MVRRRAITIKEVAELANVSQMTVSRVLNGSAAVRSETRKRVQDAILELNYRPNLMARNLARGQSMVIGILYQSDDSPELAPVVIAALKSIRSLGHHLVLEDVESSTSPTRDDEELIRQLALQSLDGLIVTPAIAQRQSLLDRLTEQGMSVVALGPGGDDGNFARVTHDDRSAARALTRQLLEKGHKRIAFVSAGSDHTASQIRKRGYELALTDMDIALDPELVFDGEPDLESGAAAIDALFERATPPTAIFCANDRMAAGVMSRASQKGLNVPEDVSVAGFDDAGCVGPVTRPRMTRVQLPYAQMADIAIEYLSGEVFPGGLKNCELKGPKHMEINSVELIEGESVSPLN